MYLLTTLCLIVMYVYSASCHELGVARWSCQLLDKPVVFKNMTAAYRWGYSCKGATAAHANESMPINLEAFLSRLQKYNTTNTPAFYQLKPFNRPFNRVGRDREREN